VNAQLNNDLERELLRLAPEERERVLAYARQLGAGRTAGTMGKSLARFAGSIEPKDLAVISEAVAAGCEQVSDEW